MLTTSGSENNQGLPPASHQHTSYIHDPKYYFKDGSVVFLIESTLFKLQASLILRPDSISPNECSSDNVQRYPLGVSRLPKELTESSDSTPIIIPHVEASQFRNFLFAVMGLPSDPKYLALMTNARDKKEHNQSLLIRYLDISCLARQFGMTELEEWARAQLSLVLESMYELALKSWDDKTLLRLDAYTRATGQVDLISSTTAFIQYFISVSADHQNASQLPSPSNLDTCVRLYKNPSLPHDNPAIFGCTFLTVLSLGKRSTTWNLRMTPNERALLYMAQVELTSISDELKSVGWLQPSGDSLLVINEICEECQTQLRNLWKESFGQCAGLKSEVALQDVTALTHLPKHRKALVSQWDASKACSQPETIASSGYIPSRASFGASRIRRLVVGTPQEPVLPTVRGSNCPKLKSIIRDIDNGIQGVYEEVARRHSRFASET